MRQAILRMLVGIILGGVFALVWFGSRRPASIGAHTAAWTSDGEHVMFAGLDGIDIRRVPELDLVSHIAFSTRRLDVSSSGIVAVEPYFGSSIGLTLNPGAAPFQEVPFDPTGTFALSPNGERFTVGDESGDVQIWQVSPSPVPRPEQWTNAAPDPVADPPQTDVERVAWSPDGQWLAGSTVDARVTIWSAVDSHVVHTWPGLGGQHLAWSADSRHLITGPNPFWRISVMDGVLSEVLADYKAPIDGIAWGADSASIITLSGVPLVGEGGISRSARFQGCQPSDWGKVCV